MEWKKNKAKFKCKVTYKENKDQKEFVFRSCKGSIFKCCRMDRKNNNESVFFFVTTWWLGYNGGRGNVTAFKEIERILDPGNNKVPASMGCFGFTLSLPSRLIMYFMVESWLWLPFRRPGLDNRRIPNEIICSHYNKRAECNRTAVQRSLVAMPTAAKRSRKNSCILSTLALDSVSR